MSKYGDNLVSNGTFDSDLSGWDVVANAQWTAGRAEFLLTGGDVTQTVSIVSGRRYLIAFEYEHTSGELQIRFGDNVIGTVSATGSYEIEHTAGADTLLKIGGVLNGFVDNVSVKQVWEPGMLVEIEDWAIETLSALTENGADLFQTVEAWAGQIGLGDGGIASFDRYAPFAFVAATLLKTQREGDFDANVRIALQISIGQRSASDGVCRVGRVDVVSIGRLFEKVFLALDTQHPGTDDTGEVLACDEFGLVDAVEVVSHPRRAAIDLLFEADWIATEH